MRLSEDLQRALDEGRGFPPGTVRNRKAGDFIKTARGDWERVTGDVTAAVKRQQYVARAKVTVDDFKKAIDAGGYGGLSLGEHIRIGKRFREQHEAGLPRLKASLAEIAGPAAKIKGRTKNLESMIGKMLRKPKYQQADQLQDGTGARIVHQNIQQVKDTVAKIKAKYKVIAEDDYISQAHPGDPTYRSHHLVIEDEDGLQKEIQIRTENQNKFADWNHDVYKPVSKLQSQLIEKNKSHIGQYAKAVSDYFFRKDSGEEGNGKPDCPDEVKASVGCVD